MNSELQCRQNLTGLLEYCIQTTCKAHNILCGPEEVFAYMHEFPQDKHYQQLSLFD